jgi:hypothetical protein
MEGTPKDAGLALKAGGVSYSLPASPFKSGNRAAKSEISGITNFGYRLVRFNQDLGRRWRLESLKKNYSHKEHKERKEHTPFNLLSLSSLRSLRPIV